MLTTPALQTQALTLLFSATDGANFDWGRIPMGASDYAMSRYTSTTRADVDPTAEQPGDQSSPADTALASFSLARDGKKLIPYIKAAQAVNPSLASGPARGRLRRG